MVSGLKMVGAGGGGFMQIVTRDRATCRAVAALPETLSEDTSASFHTLEIDDSGMTVTAG